MQNLDFFSAYELEFCRDLAVLDIAQFSFPVIWVVSSIIDAERRLGAQTYLSGYSIRLGAKAAGEITGELSSAEKLVITMCCRTLGCGNLSGAGGSSS